MSDSGNQFETLLGLNRPAVPENLRQDVERAVVQSLKRQTLIDDARWLLFCGVILFTVVMSNWIWLQRGDVRLQRFADNVIASTDEGRQLVQQFSQPGFGSLGAFDGEN